MPAPDRSRAMEHIVVALFENRSLDNVLGHLYGPEDGKTFDGVIGKDLSNPIPATPGTYCEPRSPLSASTCLTIPARAEQAVPAVCPIGRPTAGTYGHSRTA